MSGPVTGADAAPVACEGGMPEASIEVLESRSTQVGSVQVQRALPQRGRRTVGAWCFFDHGRAADAPGAELGIGPHPHIGLQTVTWLFSGEMLHRDSLGSEQPIRPGELNLMTAGHGIVHAEEHTGGGPVHLAQLWVAQPAATRDGPAAFEHHGELPQVEVGDGVATVLVGVVGEARSPARRDTDHVGMELAVRSQVVVPVEHGFEHVVVPIDGVVEVDGRPVGPGQLAHLGPGRDELTVRTSEPGRAIVLGGVPFDERILMWWNYVARTRDEIVAAHDDWTARRPRFPVPASSLAAIDVPPPPWARHSDRTGDEAG